MSPIEIEGCLESIEIFVDSREQPSVRARRRYQDFGCAWHRQKLEYGDYTYNFVLPNGRPLWLPSDVVNPSVSIERKMGLEELSTCFTRDRKRFAAEFERAKANNASVYLLVENASWEHILNGKYDTKLNPKAFMASLTAFMARYGLQTVFCKAETSGKIIKEILYRELKERLERGDYG